MAKQRMYNMDLCRVVSMFGILTLHFNLSGVIDGFQPNSMSWWCAWSFEIATICSVDIFAIMSGYLSYDKMTTKSYRLIELISNSFFECCVITILFLLLQPSVFNSLIDVRNAFFPPLNGKLWYISNFIPLFVIQPFLNKILVEMNLNQERIICFLFAICLGCIPSFFDVDIFALNGGYSFLWLTICYSLGHYLRRTEWHIRWDMSLMIFFVGFIGQIIIKYMHIESNYMMNYISPFVMAEAIGAFSLFLSIELSSNIIKRIVSIMSRFAFDVYILHAHPLVFNKLIKGRFDTVATTGISAYIIWLIIFSVGGYLFLSLCGYFRVLFFKLIRVDRYMNALAIKIDNALA